MSMAARVEIGDRVLGFVATSSDPAGVQAWCGMCDSVFLKERDLTRAFREYNSFRMVCALPCDCEGTSLPAHRRRLTRQDSRCATFSH